MTPGIEPIRIAAASSTLGSRKTLKCGVDAGIRSTKTKRRLAPSRIVNSRILVFGLARGLAANPDSSAMRIRRASNAGEIFGALPFDWLLYGGWSARTALMAVGGTGRADMNLTGADPVDRDRAC